MLLTPQPESSNPASTAKSGTRVRRGTHSVCVMRWLLSLLGGFALRFRELVVIFLRANRVGHREGRQRIVKGAALSHVSREHSWIGRTSMRAGERAPAQARVVDEGILLYEFADRPEPPVLQLAHIEMSA